MATKSIISLRGFAGIAVALVLFSICLCRGAGAQTSLSVVATGPFSAVAPHPATWGQQWETAISSKGDLVTEDYQNGGVFLFPAGGGAMVTLVAEGSCGWCNSGVAFDPWDNLWIGDNWNQELIRVPYSNGTWSMSDPNIITYGYSWSGNNQGFNTVNGSIPWFQATVFAFSPQVTNTNNNSATMALCAGNAGAIYSFTVDNTGNVLSGTVVVSSMKSKAQTIAVDDSGNIYFEEQGGAPGALLAPVGTTNAKDTDKSITRVDPWSLDPKDNTAKIYVLTAIDGVSVDAAGNVYVSDSKAGVYLVPNEGGTVNPSDAVLLAAIPAFANVDFDLVRGIMYVPTTYGANGGWTSLSGTVYNDIVAVALSNASFGSGSAYVQGAEQTITFSFTSSETPGSFEIVESGAATPDFVIVSGGSCKAGITYKAGDTCTVNVSMDSQTIGNVSATLEMLDKNGDILSSVSLSGLGVIPAVVSGPPTAVASHPATWGQQWETAISSKGDLFTVDYQNGGVYLFPAGGGAVVTLVAPGSSWGYPGIAIDPWDNLWIGLTWNNEFERIPYANGTWNMSDPNIITYAYSWNAGNQAFNTVNASISFLQTFDFSFSSKITDTSNGTATMAVGDFHSGAIDSFAVDKNGNVLSGTVVVSKLKASKIEAIAVDNSGNVYFVEQSGTPGVLLAPAGTTNATDTALTRVDPDLSNPDGVTVDNNGNIYVSDSNAGVYLVPGEDGTLKPSDAYLLAPVPAFANVDFDALRGIMYVPTTYGANGGWISPSGTVYNDVVAVALSSVNLGSAAAGSQGTATTVSFGLSAGVTPESFAFEEVGGTAPDFAVVSGGSCTPGTAYAAQSTCSVNVALDPHSAGGVSGKLLMLDAKNNILASTTVYGVIQSPAISITPALELSIGSGLKTPGEVAADGAGNSYVADAGLKQVLMYPVGASASTASVSVGTGLKAPTGVAVDSIGDVFIADSGNVYEVPNTRSGLNASGQKTLKTGLGANLNLTADGLGNLYIADPDNARVVRLNNAGETFGAIAQTETDLTGFTAPSVVAVDGNNNLYVVDSPKLIEVQTNGTLTTLLPSLGAATGLAIDPSGAVYVGMSGGSLRIPFVNGALDTGTQTTIGATVTNPTSLALDKSNNVYLADGTAGNLHEVSSNGALNVGTAPGLMVPISANAELLNIGNSPLTVTGFLSSDAVDFSATGCPSPVAVASTCTETVTMDGVGPGVQGLISSVITVQSNAAGSPVATDASGVAAALAASKTTLNVGSGANVMSIPVTISVVSASGTGPTPTGDIIFSLDGVAGTPIALSNGGYAITLSGIIAGTHTFSVHYIGDRVYGSSDSSSTVVIARATPLVAVPDITAPGYVLFIGTASSKYIPYDHSLDSYITDYLVTVTGATGLVPTGTLAFNQGSTAQCGPNPVAPANLLPKGSFNLDAKGSATFQPGCLVITTYTNIPNEVTPQTITSIVYSGDSNYAPFTVTTTANGSPILFQEIRQPSVLITPNPGSVSVPTAIYPATASASTTLTITSLLGYGVSTNSAYPSSTPTLMLNNYTLPIAFNCVGLPAHSTCSFSGGNYTDLNGVLHADEVLVNTDPAQPSSIKVTVTSNVSGGITTSQNSHSTPYEYAAIFGLGMLGLAFSRKSIHKNGYLVMICLLALTAATAGLTACNNTPLVSQAVLGTPSGSYAVSVVAQQVGGITIPGNNGTPITLYGSTNQMSLPYTLNVTVQ